MRNFTYRWMVGDWNFYQVEDHGFPSMQGQSLYCFSTMPEQWSDSGELRVGEWYNSLEHAMAAAIAEKHTGKRGAGGTAVGTAADWFMKMIGVGQLQDGGPEAGRALVEIVGEPGGCSARQIEKGLESRGYVIARQPIG